MKLEFANRDSLRLALTLGVVPDELLSTATASRTTADGGIIVDADALPRAAVRQWQQMGLARQRRSAADLEPRPHGWLQVLPLEPVEPPSAQQAADRPVLIQLERADELAGLMLEMLRLGNLRQSYRVLAGPSESPEAPPGGLLRVIGPPYFSLLRAIDRPRESAWPVAYIERRSGLWVEWGFRHPLEDRLRLPEGQCLLLRAPHTWQWLDDAGFQDLGDSLQVELAAPPQPWRTQPVVAPLRVSLSLVPADAPEAAELWVLAESGQSDLERLVAEVEQPLVERLAFAVAQPPSQASDAATIILRTRPSPRSPPVLPLAAVGYRPYQHIPNLFVPVGCRLHPPLRRETLVQVLAPDPERLVWLAPHGNGEFIARSLPESAFRPLSDWVRYVMDRDAETLQAWVESHELDLPGYRGLHSADREPPPKPAATKPPGPTKAEASPQPEAAARAKQPPAPKPAQPANPLPQATPSESPASPDRQRLTELEAALLALPDTATSTERGQLWQQLAEEYARWHDWAEAARCWLHAAWLQDEPSPQVAHGWLRAESPEAEPGGLSLEALDQRLADPAPLAIAVRRLAAQMLVWAVEGPPPGLAHRLGKLQRVLQAHEHQLPLRAMWLAWWSVARLSGGDALALAHARDRAIFRLYREGLPPDRELPRLVWSGDRDRSQRLSRVRPVYEQLVGRVADWLARCRADLNADQAYHGLGPDTPAITQLILAVGWARLGVSDAADQLVHQAEAVLNAPPAASPEGFPPPQPEIRRWILAAYQARMQQARAGGTATDRLPETLFATLNTWRTQQRNDLLYLVGRLRMASRMIEPYASVDAYGYHLQTSSPGETLIQRLHALQDEADPGVVVNTFEQLAAPEATGDLPLEDRALILLHALQAAPRLGSAFASALLQELPAMVNIAPRGYRWSLLEWGVLVASQFDQTQALEALLPLSRRQLADSLSADDLPRLLSWMRQVIAGLMRVGRRDELAGLLNEVAVRVRQLPHELAPSTVRLSLLVAVATGWLMLDHADSARPILDEARAVLADYWGPPVDHHGHAQLACDYLTALGKLPLDESAARVCEVFDELAPLNDSLTSMSHFSVLQIQIVEAAVLALAGEAFTLDELARRWLEDDELAIRRRIHRDLRALTPEP